MSRPRLRLLLLFASISVGTFLYLGAECNLGPSVIAASAITAPIPNYSLQWSDDFFWCCSKYFDLENYRTDVKDFSAQISANVSTLTPGMLKYSTSQSALRQS